MIDRKARRDGTTRRQLFGLAAPTLAGAMTARPRDVWAAPALEAAVERARAMDQLRSLVIARDGEELVARAFRGPGLDTPVNVKSVSKTLIAAMVGIAIDRGLIEGVDQPVVELLGDRVPADADPRVKEITVDHLLTMRAGLERTSGPDYGAWVQSRNWVADALRRPFVAEPGGPMLYSTGSYHLLSAALTEASGATTLALARRWLGRPLDIAIPPWTRDPQGIFMGGNNMALSPRALLRFAECCRRGGVFGGERVIPERWLERSWRPRTRSRYTGDLYGYGWFIARAGRREVHYGWGYGGQMVYVVPALALSVIVTSSTDTPSGRTGYARRLHELLARDIVGALEAA